MDYSIQQRPWTFDWTLDQLERAHDLLADSGGLRQIIDVLWDDLSEHYIALVDCDESMAIRLNLSV